MLGRWPANTSATTLARAAIADDVDRHLIVVKYPVPVGVSVDPYGGLVGADDPGAAQPSEDSRHLIIEAWHGAAEHRVQRSFADGEANNCEEQLLSDDDS